MGRHFLLAMAALAAAASSALADNDSLTPKQLAQRIDERLAAKWAAEQIQPAPAASDAEFVRRVYLDLIGRIPRVSETREFLRDPAPDKRAKLIDRLLANPLFITHWSNTWRDIILPAGGNQQATALANSLRLWIEQQVRQDKPYDKMVRELIGTPMLTAQAQAGGQRLVQPNQISPLAYFQAQEFKPENLASSTARVFLGVRLECAQCHDHPFSNWSQTNFWELAAFYSGMQPFGARRASDRQPVALRAGREIKIPGKEKVVQAKFPTGEPPVWQDGQDSRVTLAEWVTSRDNPYFARTAANRLWAQCFGAGLMEPCDDEPTDENPIRHPELLADLAQQFIAHDFDVKYLLRSIMLSQAYQRSSLLTHEGQRDTLSFARMPVRGMTPEQLFDSLATATGYQAAAPDPNVRFIGNDPSPRGQFLIRFARQDRRTETQTSILQALALMNGKFVSDSTSLRSSMTLAAVADVPFMTWEQKLETLFLAALSRPPRAEERDRLLTYVQRGGAQNDPGAALADVFWALLNTSEFLFNH
jgi:hypothetical protein